MTTRIAQLAALVADAGSGRGGLVFVAGEAGVGKTRLARETVDAARRVRDAGVAGSGRGRVGPVPTRWRRSRRARCAALAGIPDAVGAYQGALARLVPSAVAAAPVSDVDASVLVGEGLVRLLEWAGGDAGAVVVLEDVHWADPETLSVLEYLADNLAETHVACIATVRDDTSAGYALALELQRRRAAAVVSLARLTDAQVTDIATACLDGRALSPAAAAFVRDRADGLPFLVEELLAGLLAAGASVETDEPLPMVPLPLTFVGGVERRLGVLSPHTRSIVALAAVIGRQFDVTLVRGAAGCSQADVDAALAEALGAQLLATDLDGWRFRHALTREAVLERVSPVERREIAAAALDVLCARELDGPDVELAADLAEQADRFEEAGRFLLLLAQAALERGAPASAADALERARSMALPDERRAEVSELLLSSALSDR